MPLTPGQVLLDKYRIKRLLGSGGWGDVYLAEDLALGRQVAIKHLKADWTRDETILERFLQEARIIAALKHSNVVVIHALEHDGNEHYIVEEYAERGTVGDLLEKPAGLPIKQTLDIAIAVCRALEAAHLKGIIHRDIKPSNILLFESPEGDLIPKLCDFGIAHVPGSKDKRPLTADGDMLGTFQYMSPEQIRGEKVDGRSDLYSLGTVLYEMLTGRNVFTGSVMDIWQAHVSKEPRPPALERPEVSTPLNDLILRALSKNLVDRYEKAHDMRRALERIKRREAEKREKVESLYGQGMAHLQAGEWQQASRIFEEIINLAPDRQDAVIRLEEAKGKEKLSGLYKEGVELLRRRQWQGAIEKLMRLVLLDIDYEDAVDKLEEARKQQNLEILYAQGIGYFSKNKWSAAATKFKEVFSLEEGYHDATVKLEEAERQQKLETLYKQAMKQFEQRNWAAAIESLAEAAELQTNYRDVQARLEEAKRQKQLENFYRQGLEHFDREEWPRAIQAFQQILELDESFQMAAVKLRQTEEQRELSDLYNRGLRLERIEEWEEAYQMFHQILTIVPGYKDVPDRLARTGRLKELAQLRNEANERWTAGQWQEAVDRLCEAVEFDRRYGELDRRARRELNSRLRTARKSLKRQEAAYAKGIVFLEAQNGPQAMEAFRRVLELNPGHREATARLREAEERSMKPIAVSQPQLTEGLFEWKKVVQRVLIVGIPSAIIAGLVGMYLIPLKPVQLILLGLGILMILFALSMVYDIFRVSVSRVD